MKCYIFPSPTQRAADKLKAQLARVEFIPWELFNMNAARSPKLDIIAIYCLGVLQNSCLNSKKIPTIKTIDKDKLSSSDLFAYELFFMLLECKDYCFGSNGITRNYFPYYDSSYLIPDWRDRWIQYAEEKWGESFKSNLL